METLPDFHYVLHHPAFLFIASAVYFMTTMVLRSIYMYMTTGVNPIVLRNTDTAHDYIGVIMKWLMIIQSFGIFSYCFSRNGFYRWLLPFTEFESEQAYVVGLSLLGLSWLWTVIAQHQMGMSWRVGIDQKAKTDLVQQGLFSISRNPIYVGMKITLVAVFLMIPSAATLTQLVLGWVLVGVQVRLEEEYLTRVHGKAYAAYMQKVPRWFLWNTTASTRSVD